MENLTKRCSLFKLECYINKNSFSQSFYNFSQRAIDGRWNRFQFLLNLRFCGCHNPNRTRSDVFQRTGLQEVYRGSQTTLENMGTRYVKAGHIANFGPLHKRHDFTWPLNKNVNMRMQLVFQYKHFGQHFWCFPDSLHSKIALELGLDRETVPLSIRQLLHNFIRMGLWNKFHLYRGPQITRHGYRTRALLDHG